MCEGLASVLSTRIKGHRSSRAHSGIHHDADGTRVSCTDLAENKLQSEFSAPRTVGLMSLPPAALPEASEPLRPISGVRILFSGSTDPKKLK